MSDIDWQAKTLPEICLSVHMHHTGACDDLTNEEHASAVEYIEHRIGRWSTPTNAHANGRRWAAFDTAVLALCFATVAEARDWLAERAAIGVATIKEMAALPIK